MKIATIQTISHILNTFSVYHRHLMYEQFNIIKINFNKLKESDNNINIIYVMLLLINLDIVRPVYIFF